uniref:Uncharacterized protein n=1 Tax=Phocoena sinus TaxID=42100 RepID=A0A8C9CRV8_PHOSS
MSLCLRQFICSAGQNPLFIFAVKAAASFPWRFTMRKNDDRKAGAKRRWPGSSLATPAEGASGGIQSPRRGGRSDPAAL